MAQKKAHEVDSFIARPDPYFRIILVYGPDKGLVSERVRAIAAKTGIPADDPFSTVMMEADSIDSDPGRLADEANTLSMFGGQRLIWVKNAGTQKGLADAVKMLVAGPSSDALILIEAGDLKKGAALRTTVEGASPAIALPCYSDDGRGIESIIDDMLGREGLKIDMDARQALKNSLGGDRLATRSELEKLCLYTAGTGRVTLDDVRNSVGDVSSTSYDDVSDAVLSGALSQFNQSFDRLVGAGNHPFLALNALVRQLSQLQALRHAMDEGRKSASAVIASARPPIFYSRKTLMENALNRWTSEALARALERTQKALLESRKNSALATAIIRQILLSITVEAARYGNRR
ncbi:MAG: DNA polymerase III subunit delta [Phyllobacterium sp.]